MYVVTNVIITNMEKFNSPQNETRKVTLQLWGEGIRIDVLDSYDGVLNCYNALRESELFEIKVYDKDVVTEVSENELGDRLGIFDDDDDDFNSDFGWESDCYLCEPEENEDVNRINMIQTKVYGKAEIDVPTDEKFEINKVRLMQNEFVLPGSEEPVYFAVFYKGQAYPINLDVDSEREISVEEIWCNE